MKEAANLTLRRALRSDLPALGRMFSAYREFYGEPAAPEAAHAFVAARMEAEEAVALVALDEAGAYLGFAQLYPVFSSIRMGRAFILNDLYVVPEARGRGVGRALMEAAEQFARAEGAVAMSLSTARSNLPAQTLYRALGWIPESAFVSFHRNLGD